MSPGSGIMAGAISADNVCGTPSFRVVRKEAHVAEFSSALLKQAQQLSGLTVEQLAKRAGLHRVSLARYLNAVSCPPETWVRIERALLKALEEHEREVSKMRKRLAS